MDVATAGQGNSRSSSSGSVTTAHANDLLVGANLVQGVTTSPGAGYTERVMTTPDGDILEDAIVTTAGSHRATAQLMNSSWIMQMVAFRAAGPTVANLSPSSGSVGAAVTTTRTSGPPAPHSPHPSHPHPPPPPSPIGSRCGTPALGRWGPPRRPRAHLAPKNTARNWIAVCVGLARSAK